MAVKLYEWRKPPQDRFTHLYLKGEHISVCGQAKVAGQKIKDYDPKIHRGAHVLNIVDVVLCPHCRQHIDYISGEVDNG